MLLFAVAAAIFLLALEIAGVFDQPEPMEPAEVIVLDDERRKRGDKNGRQEAG